MATVTMVLACGPGQPGGCTGDRIDLRLCLSGPGRIDERAFATAPEPWTGVRSRPGQPTVQGVLVRTEEGWALRWTNGDDAPLCALEIGVVRPGEMVGLRAPDGDGLVYRIVAVSPD